jgi:glycosyltransferase involved in cell wall biosynthesis
MKITIITGIYPPDIGGPATFSKQMLNWLQNKEISSRVLTLKNKKSESISSNVIFIQRSRYLPVRILKAIPIILKNIYKKQIICTGLYEETGLCIWIIKKLFNSKNLYLARVVGDPVWERYSNKHSGSGEKINEFELNNITRLQRKLLTWSLNQFNLIICPSEELKNLCRTWGVKSNIKIISNGLEPKNNGCNNSDKKYDFITVSRIVSWKNLDLNASKNYVYGGPDFILLLKQEMSYTILQIYMVGKFLFVRAAKKIEKNVKRVMRYMLAINVHIV